MGIGQSGYLFGGGGGGGGTAQWVMEYDHTWTNDGNLDWTAASATPFFFTDSDGGIWNVFGSGTSGSMAYGLSTTKGWYVEGAAASNDRFYGMGASWAQLCSLGGGPAFSQDTDTCFMVIDVPLMTFSNFQTLALLGGIAQPRPSTTTFDLYRWDRRNQAGTQSAGWASPVTVLPANNFSVATIVLGQTSFTQYVAVNAGSISTLDPAVVGPKGMGTLLPTTQPYITGRTASGTNWSTYTDNYNTINGTTGSSGGVMAINMTRTRFYRWRVP